MTGAAVKLLAVIVCGVFAVLLLKSTGSGAAQVLAVGLSVSAFVFAALSFQQLFGFVSSLSESAGLDDKYLRVILKSLGLCIVGDFTASVCRDCGENTLAQNSELICKCAIIVVALPVYSDVYEMILKLWKNV